MSAVDLGWPRFFFFDKTSLPPIPTSQFSFKELEVHCWHSGDGFALFGEKKGGVFKINREADDQLFWKAYKEELGDVAISGNYLATVGEDETGINSMLKIWELDRLEKMAPFCRLAQRVSNVINSSQTVKATMVTMNPQMDFIVLGFVDGSAAFACENLKRERSLKWHKLCDPTPNCGGITGVVIASAPRRQERVVFVITEKAVTTYVIVNKTVRDSYRYEGKGCGRNCYTFSDEENQLVVAGSNGMHFFKTEACLDTTSDNSTFYSLGSGYDKLQVIALDSHTAVLTKHPALIPTHGSKENWMTLLTVYDTKSQHISFSCSMPSLSRIYKIDSILYIIQGDGNLSKLTEKHINAKLDILYRKNKFDTAITIAKRSESAELPQICLKYGDYLYKKGDFQNSVRHYCDTIGVVEPSYVIKKFLDGARIKHLCTYLEALHKNKVAIGHHTTILLNCYSRVGDAPKIRSFIDEHSIECSDIDAAIKVLRSAKFFDEAERLSKNHARNSTYINILIEDLQKYSLALEFLRTQPADFAVKELEQFGKLLLEQCPDQTIDLLIKIMSTDGEVKVSELMKMFVDDNVNCAKFIKRALDSHTSNSEMKNTVLELMLRQLNDAEKSDRALVPQLTAEIMQLIQQTSHSEALHLSQMFHFAPGIVYIYKKQKRYAELMTFLTERGDMEGMVDLCSESNEKQLWIELLTYMSQQDNLEEEAVVDVLKKIEEKSSLIVLKILSRSSTLSIGSLRGYIAHWLEQQNKKISNFEKQINSDASRMTDVEKQIENLEYNIQTFQMLKCSACDAGLENEAIHFFCKHSYHVNCFSSYSDQADKCPACFSIRPTFTTEAPEPESEPANNFGINYQQFCDLIEESPNCMTLISEYLRKGMFSAAESKKKGHGQGSRQGSLNPFDHGSPSPTGSAAPRISPVGDARRRPQSNGARKGPQTTHPSTNPFEEDDAYDDSLNPFS
ncbi:hypothetical protein L596_005300 [Steinernema carpocapsae]|uniref:Vacuolar protein sorting-associated protein 11 homolog n=1 Tax=Steinernema carpocapsae TaxID=34508 RepID=A0A4U8UYI6_STECR|nr:hypothetical protein L596_005300 [Steinernema carpocapsae]